MNDSMQLVWLCSDGETNETKQNLNGKKIEMLQMVRRKAKNQKKSQQKEEEK